MKHMRSWRSVVSYSAVAVLALQFAGGFASQVRAADAPLTISEINWGGSSASVNDAWIEIHNANATDFAGAIGVCIGGNLVGTVAAVPANGYALINNSLAATTSLSPATYALATHLNLTGLTAGTSVSLVQGTCASSFAIYDTTTVPTVGGYDAVAKTYASAQRIAADGTVATSWQSAAVDGTIGQNFTTTTVDQFGTPLTGRVQLLPSNVTFTPNGSAVQATSVTVAGVAKPLTTSLDLVRTASDATTTHFAYPVTPDATGKFSVVSADVASASGMYSFALSASNAAGDRSMAVPVSASQSGSSYFVYPAVGAGTLPVFNPATPAYVRTMSVMLNGTATGAASVILLRNGQYLTTLTPDVNGIFASDVPLFANSSNTITAVAKDAMGQLSGPAVITIIQDSIAPAAIDLSKLSVSKDTSGSVLLNAAAGAVSISATDGQAVVSAYADAAMTNRLGQVNRSVDGSFPSFTFPATYLGATVYLTVTDQAGNQNVPQAVRLSANVAGQPGTPAPVLSSATTDQATFTWTSVAGAASYQVKYKIAGGEYGASTSQCVGANTCSYQVSIKGLNAGTSYLFAIASVDALGVVGTFSELSFMTALPVATVSAPVVSGTVEPVVQVRAASAPVKARATASPTPTPTPEATVSPTPSPSPDAGDVSGATDTAHNWTPWVILAVLLGIAILATAGYFYWFGGEAGVAADAAIAAAKENAARAEAEKKAAVTSVEAKAEKKPEHPNASGKNKNKRW
jgi:hypothetical protein